MSLLKRNKKAPVQELDNTEQKNLEKNEALGASVDSHVHPEPARRKGESQAAYNERVPVAQQPPTEGPKLSYLGKPL